MDKIELIEQAIYNAENSYSKLKPENFDVPALTSLKIRHFLNNIGTIGKNYLECGVHKGGTFTSSVSYNKNLKHITAVDSFESDHMNGDKALPEFSANAKKFIPDISSFKLIVADCFDVDLEDVKPDVDIYLYDGGHSETDQRKALTYYLPILADEFIYLCDDYDWPEVQKGTQDGIKEANLQVLFEKYLKGNDHDNDGYWNGFYVALLRKIE